MTLYSLHLRSQRSCGRELRAEGGQGLLHRKGLWGASKTGALLFAAPVGCHGGGEQQADQCVGSLCPGGQRHQARAWDSGQTDGTAHGAPGPSAGCWAERGRLRVAADGWQHAPHPLGLRPAAGTDYILR